jgi:hypothetical protein
MENNEDIAKSIPSTKEELENIRTGLSQQDTKTTLDKAYKQNERINQCRKMVKMFDSEEFQSFWKTVHDEMEKMLDTSPRHIKGNPFEKIDQLATIQGGLEMLESQTVQMEIIRKTASGNVIDTAELEEKMRIINSNK